MRDTDRGAKALVDRVFKFSNPKIKIGILEGKAEEAKKSRREQAENEALTLIEVAIINEFGAQFTSKDGSVHEIPSRSFIRDWFDEAEPQLRDDLRVLMQSVLRGDRTKEQVLEILGQKAVGEIQEHIAAGIPPLNADATVKAKGSSTPLIDTGQLRGGVTYHVDEK